MPFDLLGKYVFTVCTILASHIICLSLRSIHSGKKMLLSRVGRTLLTCKLSSRAACRSSLVVLGIESSCDDTGAAVVTSNGEVLGEALRSQTNVHLKQGGIVPTVAADLHEKHIGGVVNSAMEKSGCSWNDLSYVAVTTGPGLALCLNAGLKYAKQLVTEIRKPLLSVHHMEAHALTVRMEESVPFPYLVLLISGGHCILATVRGVGKFSRLGETGDDSPGEALDKVARWMRLDLHPRVGHLPGGGAVEVLARDGDPNRFRLPDVMIHTRCCNFSFSGLKTAARKHIARVAMDTGWREEGPLPGCEHLCAAFQQAVCRHLSLRTHRAIHFCQSEGLDISDLVVSGGVARNNYIREALEELAQATGFRVHFPSPQLCTDNGVMVAWAGVEHVTGGGVECGRVFDVECVEEVDFTPRWPLGDDLSQRVVNRNIRNKDLVLSSKKS